MRRTRTRRTKTRLLIAAAVIGFAVTACQRAGPPPTAPAAPAVTDVPTPTQAEPLPPLGISNESSITVTLVVNGARIEDIPARTADSPVKAALPDLPWTVEVRSPSGRTLASLEVPETAKVSITSTSGMAVRKDLDCGRIDLYAGPPLLGPPYTGGVDGSCP